MSPSWSSLRGRLYGPYLRVHLAPDALVACELQRQRDGRRVVRKARFPCAPAERSAALQALRAWMGESAYLSSQEWILGSSAVRYLVLPWSPALAQRSLRAAMAGALFEQRFRQDAGAYAARFARPSYGRDQLVAFVAHELLAELDDHALASRTRLTHATPSMAVVWERFRKVLDAQGGALSVIDGDRQIVVHHADGHVRDVALRPFDAQGVEHLEPAEPARLDEVGHRAPADARSAGWKVFASVPLGDTAPQVQLSLTDGDGFLSSRDAAYAFALCGVF